MQVRPGGQLAGDCRLLDWVNTASCDYHNMHRYGQCEAFAEHWDTANTSLTSWHCRACVSLLYSVTPSHHPAVKVISPAFHKLDAIGQTSAPGCSFTSLSSVQK